MKILTSWETACFVKNATHIMIVVAVSCTAIVLTAFSFQNESVSGVVTFTCIGGLTITPLLYIATRPTVILVNNLILKDLFIRTANLVMKRRGLKGYCTLLIMLLVAVSAQMAIVLLFGYLLFEVF